VRFSRLTTHFAPIPPLLHPGLALRVCSKLRSKLFLRSLRPPGALFCDFPAGGAPVQADFQPPECLYFAETSAFARLRPSNCDLDRIDKTGREPSPVPFRAFLAHIGFDETVTQLGFMGDIPQ
jgi:hypothetical protein